MRRFICFLLSVAMLCFSVAFSMAEVQRDPQLDAAFSLIEEGNIFLNRYNELSGAQVKPLFKLGVPYVFGGKASDKFLEKYPDYAKKQCLETTKFYREGQRYIYGLDCSGFTNWVRLQCGMSKHDTLTHMITLWGKYKEQQIYSHRDYNKLPPFEELHNTARVGDLMVVHHGARHIMMYIGTLRDFGFTAEEVPELADFLDYPLMIHSGPSPFYGERFRKFIEENPEKYGNCSIPNGGVEVSLIGVPKDRIPFHEHVQINDFDYFLIDNGNYMLTVYDLSKCTSFVWFRQPE